jgi:hypothetical protein
MEYHVAVQLPSVAWSSVPGPTSRGFECEDEEQASKFRDGLVAQLKAFQLYDCFVIVRFLGEEQTRTKVIQ